MQVLKIATAATIIVGPVLDSGGLAVTNAVIGDFRLTGGGTTSTLASPATATHSHNGHYTVALSTANTSAIGLLTISSGNSNHAMPPSRFQVVNAATYDAYFALTGGGGAAGSGSVSVPFTVNDNASNPIDGVALWVSTDSAGTNVIAGTIYTNGSGLATFMLDPGSYYVWLQRNGYNFTNPQTLTVT